VPAAGRDLKLFNIGNQTPESNVVLAFGEKTKRRKPGIEISDARLGETQPYHPPILKTRVDISVSVSNKPKTLTLSYYLQTLTFVSF